MLDYIELFWINPPVKLGNLSLSPFSYVCLPQDKAERTSCYMISLHKDVSGV